MIGSEASATLQKYLCGCLKKKHCLVTYFSKNYLIAWQSIFFQYTFPTQEM